MSVCNYLQVLTLYGKETPFTTNKIIIDGNRTLNSSLFFSEYPALQRLYNVIIPWGQENLFQWQRFQTLSLREKEVLLLFAKDNSSNDVADKLFLSVHSVNTHRKSVYKKLNISKALQLVKAATLLELI
ncbi:MAG: helix-turn-helix transcriptional regulator [Nonlabens sp.]